MKRQRWQIGLLVLIGLASLVPVMLGMPGIAQAHGKEVAIKVSSFTPDPKEPLVRLYRAFAAYASDGDPLTNAKIQFTAERQQGGPGVEPIMMNPLNEPGFYAAQVTFPRFGNWNVNLKVKEAGEGEASFTEEILPATSTESSPPGNQALRQQLVEIYFKFNWRDAANIGVRVLHSLAGFTWFALTGVILVAYGFVPVNARIHLLSKLSGFFSPAAAISLGILFASGVFNAIFSAPIRPPGVLALGSMWSIPYGPQYLGAIGFKLIAISASAVIAVRMAQELKTASRPAPVSGGAVHSFEKVHTKMATAPLLQLSIANAAIGLLMLIDIAITIYLHYLSHLAVFLPQQ